ncbi:ATP-binding protein [Streptomyces sp. BI20]|uniref:ATP-binding protein n=1 Tax=Streptomyces sp. BI20 TaxID=3403460 RepID=UPI003C7565F6
MLEVVALGALTAFLTSVGNGAAGEMGKQLLLSTGALVRRATGRDVPLPADPAGWEALAGQVHARTAEDPEQARAWVALLTAFAASGAGPTLLSRGPGLPPATRHFTDRRDVVRRLRREATRPAAGRPRVALVHGPPGIGTSAAALRVGALSRHRFPDGQFHVDLRELAAGERGPTPAAVLGLLLRRMNVAADRIPGSEADREDLYRRLTADRRVMIVVDHASSVAQVRGLIPATPGVFLLIVVSGPPFVLEAESVPVPPLRDRDAVRLLRKVAGRARVADARHRLPEVLGHCAGNAFALRAAALNLPTSAPAGHPAPAPDRGPGHDPDHDPVRAATRATVAGLRPETARMLRLTALGGWPVLTPALAAVTAEVTEDEAERMLAEAVDAHLLEARPDARHRFRPEVRRPLAADAGTEHGVAHCSAAVARALDHLLDHAVRTAHAALPQSWRAVPVTGRGEPVPQVGAPDREPGAALTALVAEVPNLVHGVTLARDHHRIDTALLLARALWPLQLQAGHWDELLPALRAAARCADEERPGTRIAGALHFQLAQCLGELKRREEADRAIEAAVRAERAAGHVRGEASCVEYRGLLRLYDWQSEAAYEGFVEAGAVYDRIAEGEEGWTDLPRARALLLRHRGRALRGTGPLDESRRLLEDAAEFFATHGDPYNRARTLTDLAETLHLAGENETALARITEAERLLPESATPHRAYLAGLRMYCGGGPTP